MELVDIPDLKSVDLEVVPVRVRHRAPNIMPPKPIDYTKICEHCHKEYTRKRFPTHIEHIQRFRERKFCSKECRDKAKVKKLVRICAVCGKEKERTTESTGNFKRHYLCSAECNGKYRTKDVEPAPKYCLECNKQLVRKRRLGVLESPFSYNNRKYCDSNCTNKAAKTTKVYDIFCWHCGDKIKRHIHKTTGRLESPQRFMKRKFCDNSCYNLFRVERGGTTVLWKKKRRKRKKISGEIG